MTAKKKPVKKRISQKDKNGLTQKQKMFCREYIYDWNATRSYLKAYPGTKQANTAGVSAHNLLRNPKILDFVTEIQKDIEKMAGVSKLMIAQEQMKIAFSSIAHLHNTWIERKEFESLTEDQKACIAEISTQTRTIKQDFDDIEVEFVKIKLYDKQKAIDSIIKMFGYESPTKTELTGKDGKPLMTPARVLTPKEIKELYEQLNSEYIGS